MHAEAREFVRRFAESVPPGLRVLEVGSRDVNGGVRDLFPTVSRYVGSDIAPGPGVDVVAAGQALPFPDGSFDIVLCCEVFEHARDWEDIMFEIARVLAPQGVFCLTTAHTGRGAHSGIDGGPLREGEYYANISTTRLWEAAMVARFYIDEISVLDPPYDIRMTAVKPA